MSQNKHQTSAQLHSAYSTGLSWNLGLTHRRFSDIEIEELSVLFSHLDAIGFSPDEEDLLVWVGDKSGQFSVKSAYIAASSQQVGVQDFPSRRVWSRMWPHKVAFFLWQNVLNRLPTMDNLHKRNTNLISPSGESSS